MALLDEALGGSLITTAALMTGAILVSRVAPELGSVVAAGVKLFVEAEFEMQDGLIGTLAETAVEAMLDAMQAGGPPGQAIDAVKRIVAEFEHKARKRSSRDSWTDVDRDARYEHHIRKLKDAMQDASCELVPNQQAIFSELRNDISEDW